MVSTVLVNFGFIGGREVTAPFNIPPDLFNAERYGTNSADEMAYAIHCTTRAPVTVRLFFAKHYGRYDHVGSRIFDVAPDGGAVLHAFDTIAAGGGHEIGTMREFAITR